MSESLKNLTQSYLDKQLQTYLTAKEFAQFKLNRLEGFNEVFLNPNMEKERSEFLAQIAHCDEHIQSIFHCLQWLDRVRIVRTQPETN